MEQFIEALPAFGICLGLWLVGLFILDNKSCIKCLKRIVTNGKV